MADDNSENFVIELTDKCKDHAEWLRVMHFGIGFLLRNQKLLIEVMAREAQRECERSCIPTHVTADHIGKLLDELSLKLERY